MKLQRKDIDLRQLEIFCLIAECGSFSKAARSLYISQPTVSEHITNLESALHVRLLDRKGKQITLTSAGRLFHTRAVRILEQKQSLLKEMNEFSSLARGNLLIGASSIPGSYALPVYIAEFKKLCPEVSITLKIEGTERIIQAVKDGYYEIGVAGRNPKLNEIQHKELCRDRLILVLNPGHPLAKAERPLLPQQLAGIPFVMREKGSGQRALLEKSFAKLKVPLNIIYEMGGNEALKESVKNGDGAAILSYRSVEKDIHDGRLKTVEIEGLKFERSFYLIYHKHRTRSPVSQLFLKFMNEL